jgi:hypothetical protein
MARIVHIALKVEDLERATKFYEAYSASTRPRPGRPAATRRGT